MQHSIVDRHSVGGSQSNGISSIKGQLAPRFSPKWHRTRQTGSTFIAVSEGYPSELFTTKKLLDVPLQRLTGPTSQRTHNINLLLRLLDPPFTPHHHPIPYSPHPLPQPHGCNHIASSHAAALSLLILFCCLAVQQCVRLQSWLSAALCTSAQPLQT